MPEPLEGSGISKYGKKTQELKSQVSSSISQITSGDSSSKQEVVEDQLSYQRVKEKCLSDNGQVNLDHFSSLTTERKLEVVKKKVNRDGKIKRLEICHDFFLPDNLSADTRHYSEIARALKKLTAQGKVQRSTESGNVYYERRTETREFEEEKQDAPEPDPKPISELTGEQSDRSGMYICLVDNCDFKDRSGREAKIHKSSSGHNEWIKRLQLPDGWSHPSNS